MKKSTKNTKVKVQKDNIVDDFLEPRLDHEINDLDHHAVSRVDSITCKIDDMQDTLVRKAASVMTEGPPRMAGDVSSITSLDERLSHLENAIEQLRVTIERISL